jgi:hypothetical protein
MQSSTNQIHSRNAFRKALGCSLALSLLATFAAAPAPAQDDGMPPWLHVVVLQARSGQGLAFEDLLKDFLQARQAAGQPASQVFQVALGHPNEYHIVTPVQSIANYENLPPPMPEAQAALWQSRITALVDNVRFFYAATYPDHGVEAPANAPAPSLLLLRKVRVDSGSQAAYESWVAEQYMPAFRKSNPLGHTMSHSIYGDSLQNYYHAYPLAGWDDLGGPDPLMEILGQQRYDEVFDAIDDIVIEHEMIVARPRPDLTGQ